MNLAGSSAPFGDRLAPVIIVDDDADDAFLLRRILEMADVKHPLVTFFDASRAIDYFSHLSNEPVMLLPCLLLTDLRMAPVNGFELITWIRQQKLFASLRIAAFTRGAFLGGAVKATELGANICVEKFPGPQALRALLTGSSE